MYRRYIAGGHFWRDPQGNLSQENCGESLWKVSSTCLGHVASDRVWIALGFIWEDQSAVHVTFRMVKLLLYPRFTSLALEFRGFTVVSCVRGSNSVFLYFV